MILFVSKSLQNKFYLLLDCFVVFAIIFYSNSANSSQRAYFSSSKAAIWL